MLLLYLNPHFGGMKTGASWDNFFGKDHWKKMNLEGVSGNWWGIIVAVGLCVIDLFTDPQILH